MGNVATEPIFGVPDIVNQTPNTTKNPATRPITAAPKQSVTSQGAVIATRPASEALRHIDTSGLPYLIHLKM